jgi:hypothetical protein
MRHAPASSNTKETSPMLDNISHHRINLFHIPNVVFAYQSYKSNVYILYFWVQQAKKIKLSHHKRMIKFLYFNLFVDFSILRKQLQKYSKICRYKAKKKNIFTKQ